jgi:hypothetical protein
MSLSAASRSRVGRESEEPRLYGLWEALGGGVVKEDAPGFRFFSLILCHRAVYADIIPKIVCYQVATIAR